MIIEKPQGEQAQVPATKANQIGEFYFDKTTFYWKVNIVNKNDFIILINPQEELTSNSIFVEDVNTSKNIVSEDENISENQYIKGIKIAGVDIGGFNDEGSLRNGSIGFSTKVCEARYYTWDNENEVYICIKDLGEGFINALVYDNKIGSFAEDEYLKDKKNVGVCFSGGGSRSHILSMGQLRGLEELGLMENIKYISSVSGGNWASVEYSYSSLDKKDLLGEYINPKDLTLIDLEKDVPKMAIPSSNQKFLKSLKVALDSVKEGKIKNEQFWEYLVGLNFLSPFNLLNDFQTDLFSFNEKSLNKLKAVNTKYDFSKNQIYLQNESTPYLIVNGTIPKPSEVSEISKDFIGVEFTPLYTEIPYNANNGRTPSSYTKFEAIYLGNGAISSFCYGTRPLEKINLTNNTIPVYSSSLGLSSISGISSYFLGGLSSNIIDIIDALCFILKWILKNEELAHLLDSLKTTLTNPKLESWSPLHDSNNLPESALFDFADGGCMDNFGLMAMLRRKVEKVVVFINTDVALAETLTNSLEVLESEVDYSLTSLFACQKLISGVTELGTDISHNQVFKKEDFKKVYNKLVEKKKAGEAVKTTSSHTILTNDWWGIEESYEVEILWVYNERAQNWNNQLSDEAKTKLSSAKLALDIKTDNPLLLKELDKEFPLYGTMYYTGLGFNNFQSNALSQFASWVVAGDENKEDFINILS